MAIVNGLADLARGKLGTRGQTELEFVGRSSFLNLGYGVDLTGDTTFVFNGPENVLAAADEHLTRGRTLVGRALDTTPFKGPADLTWVDEQGLHTRSFSPFPGSRLLSSDALSSVATAGIFAAVVIPNIVKAKAPTSSTTHTIRDPFQK